MSMSKAQEMLEEENDQLVDSLKHKVSALKSVRNLIYWWSTFVPFLFKSFPLT